MRERVLLAAMAAFTVLAAGAPASAATIYSNDFESGSTAGLTGVTSITTAPLGEKFLGVLSAGQSSTLTLNTTGLSSVSLSFDLYALNSLDGDGTSFCCGPDIFRLRVNGSDLMSDTFSNVVGWTQSYGGAGSPGQTGADATGTLGYFSWGPDATYNLSFNLGSPGALTTIEFIGATSQWWDDEGFGVDNILVSGTRLTSGVPDAATWALMVGGFAALGSVLRRSRRTAVAA